MRWAPGRGEERVRIPRGAGRDIRPVETTLVGIGPLEVELRRQAAELGLQNVRFHGHASRDELRGIYRSADVLVLPSANEGMALVLLEAAAMGLPVVASNISGNRGVIVHGKNGPASDSW